ncbi:unnamed protein product [Ostreobium quekettii]|uniref:Uncharacterized protein n=1 Tax=Ostreobium quekettii TaxID=121088 RepID=A0A8S1J852_9CHLO|nr:unnamed protein product [Ostreobium quekettii]
MNSIRLALEILRNISALILLSKALLYPNYFAARSRLIWIQFFVSLIHRMVEASLVQSKVLNRQPKEAKHTTSIKNTSKFMNTTESNEAPQVLKICVPIEGRQNLERKLEAAQWSQFIALLLLPSPG